MAYDCGVVAAYSDVEIIRRCQNIVLRTIVVAYRRDRNDIIHRDVMVIPVQDKYTKFACEHEKQLDQSTHQASRDSVTRPLSRN